jgi:cytochrome b subunit of formate dehydrogenase
MSNLLPYAIAWAVLAVIVMILAIVRKTISSHEDDSIHLSGGAAAVNEQVSVAKKLENIDRWGKILTVLLAITGVVLAVLYGMQLWDASSRVGLS